MFYKVSQNRFLLANCHMQLQILKTYLWVYYTVSNYYMPSFSQCFLLVISMSWIIDSLISLYIPFPPSPRFLFIYNLSFSFWLGVGGGVSEKHEAHSVFLAWCQLNTCTNDKPSSDQYLSQS